MSNIIIKNLKNSDETAITDCEKYNKKLINELYKLKMYKELLFLTDYYVKSDGKIGIIKNNNETAAFLRVICINTNENNRSEIFSVKKDWNESDCIDERITVKELKTKAFEHIVNSKLKHYFEK